MSMWRQRVPRLAYVGGWAAALGFFVGFAAISLIESFGPSESQPGRVIERVEGEYTQTRCLPRTSGSGLNCSTSTFPAYSVIGEREDGTTWVVAGEGAYDAMQGERGEIRVATSAVTGRVVALRGEGSTDFWGTRGSGMMIFALGAVVIFGGIFALMEVGRRKKQNWGWGPFTKTDLLIALPGLALAGFGLWWTLWQPTAGLEAISTQERYGQFLETPLATVTADVPDGFGDDEAVAGVAFGDVQTEVIVASPAQLTAEFRRNVRDRAGLAVAIAVKENFGGPQPVIVTGTDTNGTTYEAIDCDTGERDARSAQFGVNLALEPVGVDKDVGATVVCLPFAVNNEIVVSVGSGISTLFRLDVAQLVDAAS